jgi:hypothetical protein
MKQKARVILIETGRFDGTYSGIPGHDYADVLTNHIRLPTELGL